VRRSVLVKWSLVAVAVLVVIAGGLWLTGWRPNFDRSIVLSERFGSAENGSAYDRAGVDLGTARKVVLPEHAVVWRGGEEGKIQLFMKKTLAFGGYPPGPMSIRDARRNMGCAVMADGGALVVATFGEWDTHGEGNTSIRLVVQVPEGVEVEKRKGLSGMASAGQEWHGQWLTKPEDAKGGYWYGPALPAEGWAAVPDVPDTDRTAR
jgi:hypothetical protein